MLALRRVPHLAAFATALAPALSLGQSFNIDLDVFFGPPSIGNGAPSAVFGAAANQPGYWNRVYAVGPTNPEPLFDLVGNATSVIMQASGGTGNAIGFNNAANTGDFALLMNDVAALNGTITYTFTGLESGTYIVYTYADSPDPEYAPTEVNVHGSLPPNPQVVTGPIPANQFVNLITHATHEVHVTNGLLVVDVRELPTYFGDVNGLQLVAVPEPSSIVVLSGLIALSRSLRRKRR